MIRHVDIKLHYACNNRCIHCVIADQRDAAMAKRGRDFRTTSEVVAELVDAATKGFDVVTFTGGEPTLRRDLPELVQAAHQLGLKVGLQTNGRALPMPNGESGCLVWALFLFWPYTAQIQRFTIWSQHLRALNKQCKRLGAC